MTVNGAYFICLQYSSEIFPTVIRGQGVRLNCVHMNCNLALLLLLFRLPCVRLWAASPSSSLPRWASDPLGKVQVITKILQVVYLAKFSPILPLLILGLCSLLGALATFFLPETAGQELPQTLKYTPLSHSITLLHLKHGFYGSVLYIEWHYTGMDRSLARAREDGIVFASSKGTKGLWSKAQDKKDTVTCHLSGTARQQRG